MVNGSGALALLRADGSRGGGAENALWQCAGDGGDKFRAKQTGGRLQGSGAGARDAISPEGGRAAAVKRRDVVKKGDGAADAASRRARGWRYASSAKRSGAAARREIRRMTLEALRPGWSPMGWTAL